MTARPAARRRPRVRRGRVLAGAGRSGLTLTEVLMSLLVMGIGVVSVATLFPLAVLRGARATQLTAGTILKQNAEETVAFSRSPSLAVPLPASIGGVPVGSTAAAGQVRLGTFSAAASPGLPRDAMLLDPDANGSERFYGPVAGLNAAGSTVWWGGGPLRRARKFVVDPLGAAVLAGDPTDAVSPFLYGVLADATAAPAAAVLVDQFAAPIQPNRAASDRLALRFAWPYPHEVLAAAEAGASITRADGVVVPVRTQMLESAYTLVGREGDYGTEIDAEAEVTLIDADPDYLSIRFFEDDAVAGSLEEFFTQVDAGGDPSADAPSPGADIARAVLFRPDVRGSAAVPLRQLRDAAAIDVIPPAGDVAVNGRATGAVVRVAALDGTFLISAGLANNAGAPIYDTPALLRVRLERPDRRYSWMLTCRRTGTSRLETEVAVFFNRALSAEDESVWRSFQLADGTYALFWDGAAQSPPLVTGGTWILEMGELKWLRIGRVFEEDGVATAFDPGGNLGTWDADDRYLRYALSSDTPRINEAGTAGPLYAAFPRGVVEVYPLSPPQREEDE